MDAHAEFLVTICTVVTSVVGAVLWINKKLNETAKKTDIEKLETRMDKLDARMDKLEIRIDRMARSITRVDKELVAIKTIMFAQGTPVPNVAMNDEDE